MCDVCVRKPGFPINNTFDSIAGRFASPVIPCVWEAKITGHYYWWSLMVIIKACWEVASPVIPCVWEAKSHVSECLPGHSLGASLGVNKNQIALPNLPA